MREEDQNGVGALRQEAVEWLCKLGVYSRKQIEVAAL